MGDISKGAVMRPYDPSWRDRIAAALMGQSRASPERARVVEGLLGSRGLGPVSGLNLADMTPAGMALSANEFVGAKSLGEAATAAMGLVPAARLAPVAKTIGMTAKTASPISRPAAKNLELKLTDIYNPPNRPPRDFALDYPKGAPADDLGKLTRTIDDDAITAPYVVGRTHLGGSDVALPDSAYDEIAKAVTGQGVLAVPQRELGTSVGQVSVQPGSRMPTLARVSSALPPPIAELVIKHEVGHVIDQAAGEIPVDGAVKKAQGVYNTLNNGQRSYSGLEARASAPSFYPQHAGYKGAKIQRELMAEAIRAYAQNPNYIKTEAPELAARIRNAVNNNPMINKIVQFNSLGVPVGLALQPDQTD